MLRDFLVFDRIPKIGKGKGVGDTAKRFDLSDCMQSGADTRPLGREG